MPVLIVDLADFIVVDNGDIDFCRSLKIFHFERRMAAAANQKPHPRGNPDGFLFILDDNFDFFHGF